MDVCLSNSTYPCYVWCINRFYNPQPEPRVMNSEYEEVVRVNVTLDQGLDAKPGHTFVSESQELPIRQYCRDMTLARGRLLYEVWDSYNSRLLGYIVPQSVLSDAIAARPTAAPSPWLSEPHQKRLLLTHYHDTLLTQFPRMPPLSARSISEAYFATARAQYKFSQRALEKCVVDHVKHFWTSYDFRVFDAKQARTEVESLVKPRMREVLKGWLPFPQEMPLTGKDEVRELFERHGLLNEYDGFVEPESPVKVKVQDWDGIVRWKALRNCGGLEGLGNSYSAVISTL